jgi:hypothetical protein
MNVPCFVIQQWDRLESLLLHQQVYQRRNNKNILIIELAEYAGTATMFSD